MEFNLDRLVAVVEDPESTKDQFDEAIRRMAVLNET